MTFEQFAYWLQGFAEIYGNAPTNAEWTMIRKHLDTCFVKVTPTKEEITNPQSILEKWKIPPATCMGTGFNPLAEKSIAIC